MKEDYKKEDIITIESSDWEMISNGDKWVLFLIELSEPLKKVIQYLVPNTKAIYTPKTIYLQENKTGLLMGEATSSLIYYLLYNEKTPDTFPGLVEARYNAVKEIYLKWCAKKSIKPNYKEGWFKSKKFSAYLNKIGWGGNYALFIDDVIKYDAPKKIEKEDKTF